MIALPRTIPMIIIVLEALTRRLSELHPKFFTLKEDLGGYLAGYKGEERLDYFLDPFTKTFNIFYGLRLKNNYFFQIDTLLLSPYFALILEVKYLTGDIFLDTPFNQIIQTKLEKITVYNDPILQAQRQCLELSKWLERHGYPEIPILYLVVFTNNNCRLSASPENKDIFKYVCKPGDLIRRIKILENSYQVEKYNHKLLGKLTKHLIKSHTPILASEILEKYQIVSSDIIIGVQCSNCLAIPMQYIEGKWICSKCKTLSRTAYKNAVEDYFILIKPTITNSELRQFLMLPSPITSNRILHSLNLPFTGDRKSRVYYQSKSR